MLDFIADKLGIGMTRRDEKGFTLIELLIVIIILGILAAIVIFAVGSLQATSRQNSCKSEKRTVETAAQAYFTEEGQSLFTAVDPLLVTSALRLTALETAGYLKDDTLGTPGMTLADNGDVAVAPAIGTCS